jgi:ubiquinone/menaquinone biosynthesis C-methylase UbiE
MALGYCAQAKQLFCSECASASKQAVGRFWCWEYYFLYQSPWSGAWCPSLDRLEFDSGSLNSGFASFLSGEQYLTRYPPKDVQWRSDREFSDADVQANWNANAARWDAVYDDDGDRNRRYQSDEPMLDLLGDVRGLAVLDVGCGNGYLCRKLAQAGARMTGVELSTEFLRIAREREAREKLGIAYCQGSVSDMKTLAAGTFDKAVSNYVLMDVRDYEAAIHEVHRVLRPGGRFVAVISHPSFACGPGGWASPAPDSPRREDRIAFRVDMYFHRGPYLGQWGKLDPVLSFHRPLRDYWQAFTQAGFSITAFEEPSITERGRRELPPSQVQQALRVPYSCIFQMEKTSA